MRIENGSHHRSAILITAVLLMTASAVVSGGGLLHAQEISGRVDFFAESFPAAIFLAKIEADGHSPSEARQLLQDRLLMGRDESTNARGTKFVAFARLQNDLVYVQGSRDYINRVKQHLTHIQEFGLTRLLYTVNIVELPSEVAKGYTEKWNLVGRVSRSTEKTNSGKNAKKADMRASLAASTTTSELRISDPLSDEQLTELIGLGKVRLSPKIVAIVTENGAEANVRVGRDEQFATSFDPIMDENADDRKFMQPNVGKIHDGIMLGWTGVVDAKKENVQLKFRVANTQFMGMGNPFTYEAEDGPRTVQQPRFKSTEVQTTSQTPINKPIALCSGPTIRETVVERGVPLIARVPYVGKLLKYKAIGTESITTFILIRCQELPGEKFLADLTSRPEIR
ncbi:MAG: hypothetical protein WCI02_12665 [Planctomycetota bacterium]